MPAIRLLLGLVSLCSIPGNDLIASDTTYYQSILSTVESNLDNNQAQQNIALIQEQSTTASFTRLNCRDKGHIIHLLGVSYYLENKETEAIDQFETVLKVYWKGCDNVTVQERANTMYNIGISYQYTSEPLMAKTFIDESIHLLESAKDVDRLDLAAKYQGAGQYYSDIRDYTRANSYLKNALRIYQEQGSFVLDELDILNQLLVLDLELEEYENARVSYRKAYSIYRKTVDFQDADLLSSIQLNGAQAYLGLGILDSAELISDEILELISVQNIDRRAIAYEILGSVALERKDFDTAQDHFERVFKLRATNDDIIQPGYSKSIALENLADLYRQKQAYDSARDYIDKAIHSLIIQVSTDQNNNPIINGGQISNEYDLIRQLSIKCKILSDANRTRSKPIAENILSIYEKIDTIINGTLLNLEFDISRLKYLDLVVGAYSDAIEHCLSEYKFHNQTEYLEKAFYFSCRSKSNILRRQYEESKAFGRLDNRQLDSLFLLRRQLGSLEARMSLDTSVSDSLLQTYVEVQLDIERLQNETGNLKQFQADLSYTSKDIAKRLDNKTVLIDFFEAGDRYYLFWITNEGLFFSETQSPSLHNDIEVVSAQSTNPEKVYDRVLASDVHQQLLGTGADLLEGKTHLILIPDGNLHYLPFEALINDNGEYFIQDYVLSRCLSTSMLFDDEERQKRSYAYAGFGSNYSSSLEQHMRFSYGQSNLPSLNRLTLAEKEITNVSESIGGAVYLDTLATLANFYSVLGQADILHLSLHGLVDYSDPLRSCIIFDDRNPDYLLTSSDLFGRNTSADLIVLSACHSADGKHYKGEGIRGMTSAFLGSGAQAVTSSLWSASESASSVILPNFLRKVNRGILQADALRAAKMDYLNMSSPALKHPFYWSNFIIVGSLETSGRRKGTNIPYFIFGCLFLLALLVMVIRHKRINVSRDL